MRTILIVVIVVISLVISIPQGNTAATPVDTLIYQSYDTTWVDSVMSSLSLEQKIAQLFSIRAYSNKDKKHKKKIASLIKKYNIGGLTFFQGGPVRQALLTNYYQELSQTPLLIMQDAEWGLGMRLDSTYSFPYQLTMGAMDNDTLVYAAASEIACQLKRIGVHVNLAPVVDINNNPLNPVINYRSFGENRYNVTSKGLAYMHGLQDHGIIATAKHFPGHGDTDADSHQTLPIIQHTKERLDSIELFPFKKLISEGLYGIMIAHLYLPAYDDDKNLPSTLSGNLVTGLLKDQLAFNGLIITDALDMKGVTMYYSPGEIEVKALQAGNDILLLPGDVPKAIKKIKQAIKKGLIIEQEVEARCRKVLEFKYRAGLAQYIPVKIENLIEDIDTPRAKAINRRIYKSAITLVKNEGDLVPLNLNDSVKIASLSIGSDNKTAFQEMMDNYAEIDHFSIEHTSNKEAVNRILEQLSPHNLIIIGVHCASNFPFTYGISDDTDELVSKLAASKRVIVTVFGSPYSLERFNRIDDFDAIMVSYQNNLTAQEISAQMILGSIACQGKLPVTASTQFQAGSGVNTISKNMLSYTIAEELNINRGFLLEVDSLLLNSIEEGVFPGCQVMALKDGSVFYQKSFGYHTYEKQIPVKNTDLFDLASITKIAATTLAVMKMTADDKIDIDMPLVYYLPFLKGTNKENIIIREMMAHQARFTPWIPFYRNTLNDNGPDTLIYSQSISEVFPFRVAEKMYIHRDYCYTIFDTIITSPLLEAEEYKYSDLPFYFLKRVIENGLNQPIEKYLNTQFYSSMNLFKMGYRPRDRFPLNSIVPTEYDNEFRQQLIHGDVHDPGAAMLGGVSGHAGLFSNANNLAVLMQMLLQSGEYNGISYLDSAVIEEFTSYQFPLTDNRRGLGFDKPSFEYLEDGPTCKGVSPSSFGHSGFTGTYVWADPESRLIYVFLSNRVHPDASNRKISERNIRTKVHQLFYDALEKRKGEIQ